MIPNMAEEVTPAGFGVEKLLVLFGGEGEVAVDVSAMEAQVKAPPRRFVGRRSQQLRFEGLPVDLQAFDLFWDSAHDSKIVGTISLRWLESHAASTAGDFAGNRFHGSRSAMRLMG